MGKKNKEQRKTVKRLVIMLLVLGLVFLGYSQYQYSKLTDEEAIRREFEKVMIMGKDNNLFPNEELIVRNIRFDNSWAIAEMYVVDKQTGAKTIPGAPRILIFRKIISWWIIGDRIATLRKMWVDSVPETLVPSDAKMFLR